MSCLPGAGTFYAFADVSQGDGGARLPRRRRVRRAAAQRGRRRGGAGLGLRCARATCASPSPAACRRSRRRSSASRACSRPVARWPRAPEGAPEGDGLGGSSRTCWSSSTSPSPRSSSSAASSPGNGAGPSSLICRRSAWGFWVEMSGQICPLTPLEIHLRHLAGEAGYQGGFLDHYLVPLLYPPGLTGRTSGCSRRCCSRSISWLTAPCSALTGAGAAGSLTKSRPSPQNSRPFAFCSHGSPVAQSVERRTVNPLVVGSSPTRGAIYESGRSDYARNVPEMTPP